MQAGSAFAASMTWRIAEASVSTGLPTISALNAPDEPSVRWICADWSAT
jgi:hypothetical protein